MKFLLWIFIGNLFPNLKLNIPSKKSVTKVVDELFEFYNVMSTLSSK